MNVGKGILQALARSLPKRAKLISACRLYLERFQEPGYENNSNMQTNGEVRLLKELGAAIKTAFDIGANCGDWTAKLLECAPAMERVDAFEPYRIEYERLTKRGFPVQVHVHQLAVSAQPGTAELYVFPAISGMNSIHNRRGLEAGWGLAPAQHKEAIRLTSIDNFCVEQQICSVDFVKIDTEGHEVDVLQGAARSLATGMLRMLQFEYGGTFIDARRLLGDVFALFAPLDYTIFVIAPDRLIAYPRYDQRLENFQYKNFIAIHASAISSCPSAQQALANAQSVT